MGHFHQECRSRNIPADHSWDHLDDGDVDAISALVRATVRILDEIGPHDQAATMADLLPPDKLNAIALLNHAVAYLEYGREKYTNEIRPDLYGYLVIT